MNQEIEIYEGKPLSVAEIKSNSEIIRRVLKDGMKKDIDYGTIPGCGDKPALFKPGSEKILSTFRIAVDPSVKDLSGPDEARYRVTAVGTSMVTGSFLGAGIGEAGTNENKYMWRAAVCDEEYDEAEPDRRRAVWKKGYQGKKNYQIKQVRTNPADLANTVLKMAKKRAQIDMTLTVTAASDVFSQDLEDMERELLGTDSEPGIQEPQRKPEAAAKAPAASAPAPASGDGELTVQAVPEKYSAKPSKNGNRYSVEMAGDWYSTFSDTDGELLKVASDIGQSITVNYIMKGQYRNITSILDLHTLEVLPDDEPPLDDADIPF